MPQHARTRLSASTAPPPRNHHDRTHARARGTTQCPSPWANGATRRAALTHCPTTVVHGRCDAEVPFEASRRYAAANAAHVRLALPEDDHALTSERSLELIARLAVETFELGAKELSEALPIE